MKINWILLISVALHILSCSTEQKNHEVKSHEEAHSIDTITLATKSNELQLQKKKLIQVFHFDSIQKEYEVYGKYGTILTFRHSDIDLEEDNFNLNIELIEIYDLMSCYLHKISTETPEGLIESAGMCFVSIENNGKQLELKKPFELKFPVANEKKDKDMRLYIGSMSEDSIVKWKKTNIIDETTLPDTLWSETGIEIIEHNNLDYYVFQTMKLGWLNCDKAILGSNTLVTADISDANISHSCSAMLVFKELRSVKFSVQESYGIFRFYGVPIDKEAVLLIYSEGENEKTHISEFLISKNMIVYPKMKKSVFNKFKISLDSLNNEVSGKLGYIKV